ncbi:unnamed protein product [Spirodela intermedia]|uniref:Uncharacterized protein n=1 Tax=Spirodela intermedia TaxID=51605 RepID=A0A7I8K661_SPIIN|nr:unnamed protein product [Spirodela intermedia]
MNPVGSKGGKESLKISPDNNFYRRLVSKEPSAAVSSFRSYDDAGAGAAVPFAWESCPGTPKHPVGAVGGGGTILLPLNPPPPYQRKPGRAVARKQPSWPYLFGDVLPRLFSRRKRRSPPSS